MRYFAISLLLLPLLAGCGGSESGAKQEKGIILLKYAVGSESTENRERGFLETIQKEYPEIHILSSDQYAGTVPQAAQDKAQQMLLKYGDRVTGIFCVCEPNAEGMLKALEQVKMAGKVKLIGFDPSSGMNRAMERNHMQGIVLQDPVRMGYLSVKTMVDHLEGKEVKKRISTGETVATPENMHDPEIAKLLSPQQFKGLSASTSAENAKYTIAVIPKGTSHEFWKSVHFGADQAAKELGNVHVIWQGPLNEGDRSIQIDIVNTMITKKVDGICLAPLDSRALVEPVRQAAKAGIPTVIFDSGLDDESDIVSYVATDNYQGGVLAARRLAEVIGYSKRPPSEKSSEASGGSE